MINIKHLRPILDLCDRIENETNYCIFFDYSGHVKKIEIRIAASIQRYNDVIEEFQFYTDDENAKDKLIHYLDVLKDVLKDGKKAQKLIERMSVSNVRKSFSYQSKLGVPAERVLANLSNEYDKTVEEIKEIVNLQI